MFLLKIFIIANGRAMIMEIIEEYLNPRIKAFIVIPRARVTTKKNQYLKKISAFNFINNKINETAIAIAITIAIRFSFGVASFGGSNP